MAKGKKIEHGEPGECMSAGACPACDAKEDAHQAQDYIGKLFDRINGGDDVDAAAEAEEILRDLVTAGRYAAKTLDGMRKAGHLAGSAEVKMLAAIARAEGR
jgi:hypothetical protein